MVPTIEQSFNKLNKLIDSGFPVKQVVLRIDPIIPTKKGIKTALNVIKVFKDSGITRIRYSSLDMYDHVKERFIKEGITLPYETFHADKLLINGVVNAIHSCAYIIGAEAEACGEPNIDSIPCISQKDIDILGLGDKITLEGSAEQRGSCGCPKNKRQLIKTKPGQCSNGCLYCFWH